MKDKTGQYGQACVRYLEWLQVKRLLKNVSVNLFTLALLIASTVLITHGLLVRIGWDDLPDPRDTAASALIAEGIALSLLAIRVRSRRNGD